MADQINPNVAQQPWGFTPPEIQGDILQNQRTQALANALLQKSMVEQNPVQSAGRYVVPFSPMQGLNTLTAGFAARNLQNQAVQQQQNILQRQMEYRKGVISQMFPDLSQNEMAQAVSDPETFIKNRQELQRQQTLQGQKDAQQTARETALENLRQQHRIYAMKHGLKVVQDPNDPTNFIYTDSPVGQTAPHPFGSYSPADRAQARRYAASAEKITDDVNRRSMGARDTDTYLKSIGHMAEGVQPGPSNAWKQPLGRFLTGIGVDEGTVNGILDTDLSKAENIGKINTLLAGASAKSVSSRPALLEFQTFMRNNPNIMMQPRGMQMMLDEMHKINQRAMDEQKFFADYSTSHDDRDIATQYENEWNNEFGKRLGSYTTPPLSQTAPAVKGATPSSQQVPPASQRVKGQTYTLPKGTFTWTGTGWTPVNAAQ